MVVTQDSGLQPVRWIGRRTVFGRGAYAPVQFGAGALNGLTTPLLVSPQHRILLSGYQAELLFGESEVFAAADQLIGAKDVSITPQREVTYLHLMFDRHEVIFSNSVATESFYANEESLSSISDSSREELFQVFPQLRANIGAYGDTARMCLNELEAKTFVSIVAQSKQVLAA